MTAPEPTTEAVRYPPSVEAARQKIGPEIFDAAVAKGLEGAPRMTDSQVDFVAAVHARNLDRIEQHREAS